MGWHCDFPMKFLKRALPIVLIAFALMGCNRISIWTPPVSELQIVNSQFSIDVAPAVTEANVVILVHAIWRWPGYSMRRLVEEGRRRGFEVVYFRYSGLLSSFDSNVTRLERLLERYQNRSVSLITHSYGGLLVRRLLERDTEAQITRLVMIGTPNQGSMFAQTWHRSFIYRMIFGMGGLHLTPDAARRLPEPDCEYGIIAGTGGDMNPFPLGANDGVVGVSEAYLPGAREFRVLPESHEGLPNNPEAVRASYDFLETGSFGLDPID